MILDSNGQPIPFPIPAPAGSAVSLAPGFDPIGPTPEPEWQRALDRLAPRDGVLSWLKLAWLPGYAWQPVGRWVLYQMVEKDRTPDVVLRHLDGPDPRTLGAWDPVAGRWVSRAQVSRFQWDLYRSTGCYATTFWIVQGARGGHRAKFDRVESALSVMRGGPAEPPVPGALPYAPFDNRVVAMLDPLVNRFDERFRQVVDFANRRPDALNAEDLGVAKRMQDELWRWLESQVQETLEPEGDLLRRAYDGADLPRSTLSRAEIADAGFDSDPG